MGFVVFDPRFDEPGYVHHVIQKAVAGTSLFRDEADRERYVRQLRETQAKVDVEMLVQGLLTTHTHGMAFQKTGRLAAFMQRWASEYAHGFNRRHDRKGHLFGQPFWSRPIFSEAQFLATLRYVLRNPLEAGIVRSVEDLTRYPWASLAALLGRAESRTEQNCFAILAHFSDDIDEARHLLLKWIRFESSFDPFAENPCPTALDEFDRIASKAFRQAFEREEERHRERKAVSVESIVQWACLFAGIDEGDLRPSRRTAPVCEARSLIAFVTVDLLGLPQSDIAARLGVSAAAVSKSRPRGEITFKGRFGDSPVTTVLSQVSEEMPNRTRA